MPKTSVMALLWVCLLSAIALPALAVDINTRFKVVGTWFNADQNDSVSLFGVDPAYSANLDARLTLSDSLGGADSPWQFELAGELTALQGDVIENAALFGGQSSGESVTVLNDSRRSVNLTTNLSTGSRHALTARIDRAQLVWQRDKYRVRIGRQALSLGSGRVFNPMDIFSPFAPTATDRDFKTGDDALVLTRLGDNGSELELIAVARRSPGGKGVRGNQSSFGVRYRSTIGALEYELVAASHFAAEVAMASLSGPLGGAVWRINWTGTRDSGHTTHSLIANLDYGFGFREQAGYAFVEYYHNGFGDSQAAENLTGVTSAALERLARGELFVLEKNYLAAGVQLGLTPLLNLSSTLIANLHDGAPLMQSALSYTAGNNATLEAGAIVPFGSAGDEFGGLVVQPSMSFGTTQTDPILSGTSRQFYLRWVWYL